MLTQMLKCETQLGGPADLLEVNGSKTYSREQLRTLLDRCLDLAPPRGVEPKLADALSTLRAAQHILAQAAGWAIDSCWEAPPPRWPQSEESLWRWKLICVSTRCLASYPLIPTLLACDSRGGFPDAAVM
jgi:hypothetical protein